MTISSDVRQAGPYLGNGVTVAFPFYFKVFAASELHVVFTDASGIESTLALTTDYTVALNGNQNSNPGGTLTLLVPPAAGTKLTITSNILAVQSIDLTNQGGFYPKVITNAFDRLTIIVQQALNSLGRSIKFPISDSGYNPTLPSSALRKGRVLAFNETTGDPAAGPSIAAVDTVAGASANIGVVATNVANVNTVAGSIGNVNAVGVNIGAVVNASTNMAAIIDAPNQANSAALSAASAALDKNQTSLDRTQTGLDATATAADRVQTDLDKQAAQTAKTDSQTAAANSAASANNAANSVVSQLSTIKTQTETARDQALAGLGAADNSQILAVLMGESSFLMDMIGQGIKELYRYEGVTDPRLVAIEPAVDVLAQGLVDLADLLGVTARAVSGGDIMVRLGTVDNPSISIFGNRNTGFYSPAANQLAVTTGGVQRLLIDASGNHLTGTDNAQTLGSAAKRWSTVYAGTGTINTSDAREKTAVASLTADEIAAAKDLSKEVGTYQFLDSIAAKGNAARHHVGLTVQRAIEIMRLHNLDPMRYGFVCYDIWPEVSIEHPAVAAVPEVLDADGNILEMGTPAQAAWTEVIQTAGDRYSFRYDQLNLFIAAGLNARLAALEPI
ncbi:MAG: hypothetical protein PHW66_06460 [Gallionella sp.]|nr:hypothetical protein [Gallionella sp.]